MSKYIHIYASYTYENIAVTVTQIRKLSPYQIAEMLTEIHDHIPGVFVQDDHGFMQLVLRALK